ncbi:MAG: radical SAM protein [Nitrospirae bacterium]|nr:MAG: radical SAM protein [Nitrospirota bacterium]
MSATPQRITEERVGYGDGVLAKLFGDRYTQYRELWNKACKRETITEFPLYLQFEFTPFCNLSCVSCIHGIEELKSSYTAVDLSMDYEKIILEAERFGCPSISFHNNNEPLLVRDLEDKIGFAKRHGFIDLILTTNATLLSEERADRLLESGLTKINFSIDAYSEEAYRLTRRKGDFRQVLANIEGFLELKKKRGYELPITRVTFLINRNNYAETGQFRAFWKDRVDLVEFQNFQALDGYTEALCPPGYERYEGFECTYPWQQVVVRSNGDVLPCCSFYGADIVLGNIAQNSIYELWHGEKIKALRESLSHKSYAHASCRRCARTFYKKSE